MPDIDMSGGALFRMNSVTAPFDLPPRFDFAMEVGDNTVDVDDFEDMPPMMTPILVRQNGFYDAYTSRG